MKKLSTKAAVFIIVAAMIAVGGLFVAELWMNAGQLEGTSTARALIIMAGLVLALVRVLSAAGGVRNVKMYEATYREHIRTAFCEPDRKKEKKALLTAIAYYSQDQYNGAIKKLGSLHGACRKPDDHAAVLFFLALSYSDSGFVENAIDTYFELLTHDDTRSTVWSNLGVLLKNRGKHRDAINCYLNAVKHDPQNEYAWNNLAQAYLQIGEWEESISPALKAVELRANMYQAENVLAIAYFAMGEKQLSQKYYELAVMHGSDKGGLDSIMDALAHGRFPFDTGDGEHMAVLEKANGIFRRATAKPMVTICLYEVEGKEGRGDDTLVKDGNVSRVGGMPVDAAGDVPLDAQGNPMHLLAAIWCSEVSGVPDFPNRGVLRFYIADNATYGADLEHPTDQSNFRVLYDEDESLFATHMAEDESISATFPVKHVFSMQFLPEMSSMLSSDVGYEVAMDNALRKAGVEEGYQGLSRHEQFSLKKSNAWGGHRMGGYPCFERHDPRKDHSSLQAYDTLLLQIVTHVYVDKNGKQVGVPSIEFGHDGGCQFMISREKLRALDFSDVLYWWDDAAN